MARFRFSIAAWYKAINKGRLKAKPRRLVVDWAAVQQHYDVGHTYGECRAKFHFSPGSWTKAVKNGALSVRSHRYSLERILAESKSRFSVKRRLLEVGLLETDVRNAGLRSGEGYHCPSNSTTATV
jgi:hypothetical protein